jgi:phospholipid transport system transporter-binding protein
MSTGGAPMNQASGAGIPLLEAVAGRWLPVGPLTMDTAATLLDASVDSPLPDSGVVDLARVARVDSACVALMLAWKRRAAGEGKPLAFVGTPASLTSLAMLYGVGELLAT